MPSRARSTLILVTLVFGASCRRPARQPNVLIITVDTLRADHLGCYGLPLARTPRIDLLAKEGVLCSDAITAAPITLPSHCSIMTGLFPPAHGVRDNGTYALGDKAVTLAERLKGAGYETRAFVSALVLNRRYNLNQGFDSYDDDLWAEDAPKLFMIRERPARKTADRVLEWFGKRPKTGAPPFFAWVHFFDPHQPYKPEAQDRVLAPSLYDAEIAGVDRAVGRLLDALKAADVLDDTLVILTADHGESLGEHGEKTHAIFIYDATLHVPLLMRYPRVFHHSTYNGPVRSVDIVPTVLSVLGLPGGNETQGVDLVKAFRGDVPPPDLIQYSESLLSEVGFGMAPLAGIRHGGYKWIRAPRSELYDLKNDPRELKNLLPEEARRGAVMDQELSRILDESARREITAKESPMSRETQEALVSLGYLTPAADRKSMGGMDPKDGIAIYNELEEARHLAQNKRWGQAEERLKTILAKQPAHLSARNILALTLLQQGKFEEARAEYLASLKQDPKQSRVLGMLGSIAILENHLDDAERLYKGALEITPAFVEAICNLGFVASLKGDDAAAQDWYARALAVDPGFPRPWRLSADLYYERGDFAKARQSYLKVLEKEPDDFESLIQLGNCERRLANDAGALEAFGRAGKLRPDSWIPAYNRACLDSIRGRGPEALALLDTAASKGLSDPSLLSRDHDLDPLRKSPEFVAVARKVELAARAAAEDD
jgi:choline-sulfatase